MLAQQKIPQEDALVVLLAIYDQQISEEVSRAFGNRKIEFLTFNTTRDIIPAMAGRKIDLMIIDPEVTALKGLETLSIVKKLQPQARIIAISDDLSFETRAALVKEGILYQIQAPISPEQIIQLVGTVVDKLDSVERKLSGVV